MTRGASAGPGPHDDGARLRWPGALAAAAAVLAVLMAGCASGPSGRDGPADRIPPGLERVPDAVPRVEPLRQGGPNKPYAVNGRTYVPETRDVPMRERGLASWYGRRFHGRSTANGETYDMHAMTAAHPTMPLPSYARVRNPANGREVVVRINDRGPFVRGRVIDLSYTAALKLDLLRGVAPVEVERLTHGEIRSGRWRRDDDAAGQPAATSPEPVDVPPAVARAPVAARPAAPVEPAAPRTPATGDASATAPIDNGIDPSASGFWVQLGAFQERVGAVTFQQRVGAAVDWLAPTLSIHDGASLYRLQSGPYASREEATGMAERVRDALQLVPLIIERR